MVSDKIFKSAHTFISSLSWSQFTNTNLSRCQKMMCAKFGYYALHLAYSWSYIIDSPLGETLICRKCRKNKCQSTQTSSTGSSKLARHPWWKWRGSFAKTRAWKCKKEKIAEAIRTWFFCWRRASCTGGTGLFSSWKYKSAGNPKADLSEADIPTGCGRFVLLISAHVCLFKLLKTSLEGCSLGCNPQGTTALNSREKFRKSALYPG